jgi:hypothetical protein
MQLNNVIQGMDELFLEYEQKDADLIKSSQQQSEAYLNKLEVVEKCNIKKLNENHTPEELEKFELVKKQVAECIQAVKLEVII